MNKKSNKIRVLLSVIIVLFGTAFFISDSKETSAVNSYTLDDCLKNLPAALDWQTLKFAAFLDVHFSSKKNNTYLISEAITAFGEYKTAAMAELAKYAKGGASNPFQFNANIACVEIVDQKTTEAREMLKNHVMTTTGVKHGQILLDKYKAINSKLSDMNFLIGKIAGSYAGFKNKFPGFAKDCLTSK